MAPKNKYANAGPSSISSRTRSSGRMPRACSADPARFTLPSSSSYVTRSSPHSIAPRPEDGQLVEESRAVAAEAEKQLLFRVLEVPEKDAEPDDAGRVGVGPHDAEIDVMKEWTRGHAAGDFNMWGSAPHPGSVARGGPLPRSAPSLRAPARRPANQATHATGTAAITSTR